MCIFLVCACTTIPIGYLDTLGTAYKSLRNYPGTEIDKDYYDGFQYSFIRAQFSGAPPVILVLSKVENNEFFWVGSDGSTLTTNQDGKLIKTEGMKPFTMMSIDTLMKKPVHKNKLIYRLDWLTTSNKDEIFNKADWLI